MSVCVTHMAVAPKALVCELDSLAAFLNTHSVLIKVFPTFPPLYDSYDSQTELLVKSK